MWKVIEKWWDNDESFPEKVAFIDIDGGGWENIFTNGRMSLLKLMRMREDRDYTATVGQLSRSTGRPRESVSRDLRYLERAGLIEMRKSGRERHPVLMKRMIITTI